MTIAKKTIRPRLSPEEISFLIDALEIIDGFYESLQNEKKEVKHLIDTTERGIRKYGMMYDLMMEYQSLKKLLEKLKALRLSKFNDTDLCYATHAMLERLQTIAKGSYIHRDTYTYERIHRAYEHIQAS